MPSPPPVKQYNTMQSIQVFATDGVLERVWFDTDLNGNFNLFDDEMGLAYWNQYEDIIYTSRDFSCENAATSTNGGTFYDGESYLSNNCLEKGDFLVLPSFTTGIESKNVTGDITYGTTRTDAQATLNTAGLFEIMKISVEDFNAYRLAWLALRCVAWRGVAWCGVMLWRGVVSCCTVTFFVHLFSYSWMNDNS